MIGHILCCVDGSRHATAAVDLATDLAGRYGARLTLLHVVRDSEIRLLPDELRACLGSLDGTTTEGLEGLGGEILRRHAERARTAGAPAVATAIETAIETGHPALAITAYARDHDVSLIVMGRRGLSDLKGLLLGSVSAKVLQLTDCACLIVR